MLLATVAALAVLSTVAPPTVAAQTGGEDTQADPADTTRNPVQPGNEIPAGAGRIIGSPDAGPDPQHSGDRGGSLQFVTLGVVTAAIAFIIWRVTRASRHIPTHMRPPAHKGK